ncbi:hypothetical protein RI844_07240 [Thalassotalea fonticola]|uniref:Uncharacterized protein n=1 Tax=Thalassotalea fonticola TaxID=3065649 RepID=A0ABZ0GTU0_9GAMM|nr:hypothetical protein RI844_07240 [Colwelliaceae bacterium S1-1]
MKRIVAALIILLLMLSSGAAINKFKQNSPTLMADTIMPYTNSVDVAATSTTAPSTIVKDASHYNKPRSNNTSQRNQTGGHNLNNEPTIEQQIIKEAEITPLNKVNKTNRATSSMNTVIETNSVVHGGAQTPLTIIANVQKNKFNTEQMKNNGVDDIQVSNNVHNRINPEQVITVTSKTLNLPPPIPPGTLGGGNGNGGPGAGQQSASSN